MKFEQLCALRAALGWLFELNQVPTVTLFTLLRYTSRECCSVHYFIKCASAHMHLHAMAICECLW